MKKILHLQIPLIKGEPHFQDRFAVSADNLGKFLNMIRSALGDEFVVVASPCEPSLLSEEDKLYNFNMEQITLKELKEMISEGKSG
jgi:hypothetical protein